MSPARTSGPAPLLFEGLGAPRDCARRARFREAGDFSSADKPPASVPDEASGVVPCVRVPPVRLSESSIHSRVSKERLASNKIIK